MLRGKRAEFSKTTALQRGKCKISLQTNTLTYSRGIISLTIVFGSFVSPALCKVLLLIVEAGVKTHNSHLVPCPSGNHRLSRSQRRGSSIAPGEVKCHYLKQYQHLRYATRRDIRAAAVKCTLPLPHMKQAVVFQSPH